MIIWVANCSYFLDTLEQTHKYPCHYHPLKASNGRCWPFKKRSWKLRRSGDPVWPEFLWKRDSENNFFSFRFRIGIHLLLLFWLVFSIRAAMQKKTFVQIFQRWRNISLFSGIARIGVINDTGLLGLQAELCQEGQMAYSIVTQMQCERWWYLPRRDVVCKHTYDLWPILALMLQCNFPSRYFQASPYTFILHTCSCLSKT